MPAKEKEDKLVKVVVNTTQGQWETEFRKNTKIETVKMEIIIHFGFSEVGNYEIHLDGVDDNPLKPQRTLQSYHIRDGAVLIFTDLGVAVQCP